jgi:hypothetical protein
VRAFEEMQMTTRYVAIAMVALLTACGTALAESPKQRDRDRYDCQRSAAETACLEVRGYSVK